MTQYVALLRGIMPMNPNTCGEKLREVFESLGFKNVATVIASGNVVFEINSQKVASLETKIEKALLQKLDFKTTAIVRSKEHLEKLVQKNPFKNVPDKKPNYLVVTFFKNGRKELCTVVNLVEGKTPDFMRAVEREHGKEITTRTWKTVGRILKKMETK